MTTGNPVNPSEVGWQFVPQYYTFVNKQPNRLHCFYTKASTFIHGTEGEDGKPCYGQQEIHAKITSIGFQDCKVFIHSVDAQSSANGGIIIQVIGEMSNKGDAWRKFVQTFFLAEQPNGYFVLNDIFRFLKEETVEDEPTDDEPPVQDAPALQEPVAPSTSVTPAPVSTVLAVEPELEHVEAPATAPADAPTPEEEDAPEPAAEQQVNGVHEPEAEAEPAAIEPPPAAEPAPSPAPVSVSIPAQEHPAPPPSQPSAAQAVSAPAPAPAAPTPNAPPVRKTWANLAATGSQKWGSNVAEAKAISEAPVVTSSPAPAGTSQSPAPRPPQGQHPLYVNATSVTTTHCFVKGVVETVSDAGLRNTLTTRFGPIKEFEIVRGKACAFIEFQQLDAAKRAIIASLPIPAGGEGGIRIEGSADGPPPRIFVETRKERGERPPPRGPPVNGERGRGGYRGRGGPPRGRGIPAQK
ncbi:hypothetical protein BDW22DRAFT_1352199 [Trametopsis cervina]|nr:hypothetical protein BDW22DRAFT_1352199 [Trametopsis cervina]